MIASVARDSGRSVQSVGADSYALTLWAFLHGKDAEHIASLVREAERIDSAEMHTRGFLGGMPEIQKFRQEFRAKFRGPVTEATRAEMRREATQRYLKFEQAKKGLVS